MDAPTPDQIAALAEAMAQLLDDMGKHSFSVCGLAKAAARIAFEPFVEKSGWDDFDNFMSLEEARRVVKDCNG